MFVCAFCAFLWHDSRRMKFLRPLLVLLLLAVLLIGVWLWWSFPRRVDMADYAPADSIVYVEFNNLAAVAQAIQNSDVWQAAAPDHAK